VNHLKETGRNTHQEDPTGCNTCHPGNNIYGPESTGPEAEASIDCLVCHSSTYDYSKRKPYKDEQGRVVMGQDRSKEAALSAGKPGVKNCMSCHEKAGGGALIKRGFDYRPETDVHAANKMVCVDCHKAEPVSTGPTQQLGQRQQRADQLPGVTTRSPIKRTSTWPRTTTGTATGLHRLPPRPPFRISPMVS
jgi:hypothetical protein